MPLLRIIATLGECSRTAAWRRPSMLFFLTCRPCSRPRHAERSSASTMTEVKTMHSNCDQQNLGCENHPEAETEPSGVVVWMLDSMP